MTYVKALLFVPFLALMAPACGGGDGGGGGGNGGGGSGGGGSGGGNGTGGGSGTVTCQETNVAGKDVNNYSLSSSLAFPTVTVKAKTNLKFDWSQASGDLMRHKVDVKEDIDSISVLMFGLPLEELQKKMSSDAVKQSELVVVPLIFFTDGTKTEANLTDFTLNGNPIDAATILSYFDTDMYPPDQNTYVLMTSTGTVVGQGLKMLQTFVLKPDAPDTTVFVKADSTKITLDVNLQKLTPTGIPAGKTDMTFDWSDVVKNAQGNTFIESNITSAFIGHYNETPAELEKKFLDIEIIATDIFRAGNFAGSSFSLSEMKTDGNKPFAGIDDQGTWLLGLQCGVCRNPAPWYLTVLKPCSK
jgi:hypothetical protein